MIWSVFSKRFVPKVTKKRAIPNFLCLYTPKLSPLAPLVGGHTTLKHRISAPLFCEFQWLERINPGEIAIFEDLC